MHPAVWSALGFMLECVAALSRTLTVPATWVGEAVCWESSGHSSQTVGTPGYGAGFCTRDYAAHMCCYVQRMLGV
jgi:hypothetical protein